MRHSPQSTRGIRRGRCNECNSERTNVACSRGCKRHWIGVAYRPLVVDRIIFWNTDGNRRDRNKQRTGHQIV
jgi:hypothetical protein